MVYNKFMKKNNNLITLGQQIKNKRIKLKWSQEKLAFESGIDRSYIGGVERGERNLSILKLCKIANALSVTVSFLTKKFKSNRDN